MSIPDEIRVRIMRENGRRLFYLPPLLSSDPMVRTLIVSNEVKECVASIPLGNWEGQRRGQLRGRLDAFTRGDLLTIGQKPYDKDSDAMLARTHPTKDEIWDIRSTEPLPGIRCFGAFGDKDLFIALTWAYREDIGSGRGWQIELRRCKAVWTEIFGSIPRLHKGSLNEYITRFRSV